jgi:GNAT superfamily N-acetyltransferase
MVSSTLQISLIADQQIPAAGEVLARAFFDDPLCVFTQPDPEARISQFTWLFTDLVRDAARQRSAYASARVNRANGIAVWAPPQVGDPAAYEGQDGGTDQMGLRFNHGAHHRFTSAYRHFECIHRKCMTGPHWYLGLLGVSPEWQGRGIGSALLAPVLQRADHERLPCYLETFVPQNVPFYERLGFRVAETGVEPLSRIPFWAMRRRPIRAASTTDRSAQ